MSKLLVDVVLDSNKHIEMDINDFYSDIGYRDEVLTKMKLRYNNGKVTTVYSEEIVVMLGEPYFFNSDETNEKLEKGTLVRFFEFRKNSLGSLSTYVHYAPYGNKTKEDQMYYILENSVENMK